MLGHGSAQGKIGDDGSHQAILKPPPATEYATFAMTNPERTPAIRVMGWGNLAQLLAFLSRRLQPTVGWANAHRPGVKSQTHAERFQCAFLSAPKQCQEQRLFFRRRSRDERSLVHREVVGNEGLAPGFDRFQITTEAGSGMPDSA